jgi:hypothetical protein
MGSLGKIWCFLFSEQINFEAIIHKNGTCEMKFTVYIAWHVLRPAGGDDRWKPNKIKIWVR